MFCVSDFAFWVSAACLLFVVCCLFFGLLGVGCLLCVDCCLLYAACVLFAVCCLFVV